MSKKRKIISLAVLGVLLLASLALSLLLGKGGAKESLQPRFCMRTIKSVCSG